MTTLDLLQPLDDEAARITGAYIESGEVPDINDVRARLELVYNQLPEEAKEPNAIGLLALAVGIQVRSTPALGRVEKLSTLVCQRVDDELNKIQLNPRELALPEGFDKNGGTVVVNGERLGLPIGYWGTDQLPFVELIDSLGLDSSVRGRLLSKVLPKIMKTRSGIEFKSPEGEPMFCISKKGELVNMNDSPYGVSTCELLAALYAIRRSEIIDDTERKKLCDQVICTTVDDRSKKAEIQFANGTIFRESDHGIEEKRNNHWNFQSLRGGIEPLIIDEMRRAGGAAPRKGYFRGNYGEHMRYLYGSTNYIFLSPDSRDVQIADSRYDSLIFLFDAIRIIKERIQDGERPTRSQSMLNAILNKLDISVEPTRE